MKYLDVKLSGSRFTENGNASLRPLDFFLLSYCHSIFHIMKGCNECVITAVMNVNVCNTPLSNEVLLVDVVKKKRLGPKYRLFFFFF